MKVHDPFPGTLLIYGAVHPDEYDWLGQMMQVKRMHLKNCEPFVPMDVGKVLGLAEAYRKLLEEKKQP